MQKVTPISVNRLITDEQQDHVLEPLYKSQLSKFIIFERLQNERNFSVLLSNGSIFNSYDDITSLVPKEQTIVFLGFLDSYPIFSFVVASPSFHESISIDSAYMTFSNEESSIIAQANCVANFLDFNSFCGGCGKAFSKKIYKKYLHCENCNKSLFPTYSPCVIIRIENEDSSKILLTHRVNPKNDKKQVWTHVSGYIDSGESAERAISREALEEVKVSVKPDSIRFLSTQPWSFTNSLMISASVIADDDTNMAPDFHELDGVRWVSRDFLKKVVEAEKNGESLLDPENPNYVFALPRKFTIARFLIDCWLEE